MDLDTLRRFFPLKRLAEPSLRRVAEAIEVRDHGPGEVLFRLGERDGYDYFLLSGEVVLQGEDKTQRTVVAGDELASHPLAGLKPRRYTATTRTGVRLARIAEDRLDELVTTDQTTAYEVTEFEGSDPGWMFRLTQSLAMQRVPAANLAALFKHLEEIPVHAGDTIIRQGEPGDYYYLIHSGRAEIRRAGAGERETVLATIGPGESFGEEALLSGERRNATVRMLEDGRLMRLSARDFNAILKPSLVRYVDAETARQHIRQGALLVDVRLEDEYRHGSLAGSVNIPVYLLRLKARNLDRKRSLVLFFQTERRSSSAAFILNQMGFEAVVLKGGLNATNGELV